MSLKPLSQFKMFSYATGDLGMNLNFQVIGFLLAYFYTDVFGISAWHVGTLFLAARVWDAVNDPLMGYIADHTNTRWGRFRPYVLFGALPLNLVLLACFFTPQLGDTGKVVYAYVTYIMHGMVYTAVGLPYSSISAVMTQDQQERAQISAYRMFFAIIVAQTIVTVGLKPLVAVFSSEQVGYATTAAIFGASSTLLLVIAVLSSEERVAPRREPYGLKNVPQLVFRNPALLTLSTAMFLNTCVWVMPNAVAAYYFKYYFGADELYAWFFFYMVGPNFIGIVLAPFLSKRYGKRFVFILGSLLVTVFCLIRFFVPVPLLWLLVVVSMAQATSQAMCAVMQWGMLPDTVEYGQHKTGLRSEGIPFAFFSFTQKLGMAFGGAVAMYILDGAGYKANEVQSASSLLAINGLFNIAPALVSAGCLVALLYYPITTQVYEEIRGKLAEASE